METYAIGGPASTLRSRPPATAVIAECLSRQEQAAPRGTLARILGLNPLHPDARPWYAGAIGELHVARALARLGPEWTTLHSVPVGNRDSDIDHVVIGPGGVFTINTKHHDGARVWVGDTRMLVNGQRVDHLRNSVHEASRAGKLLARALEPAAQTPAAQTPAAQTPAAQTPAAQTPPDQTPSAQAPRAEPPTAPPAPVPPTSAPVEVRPVVALVGVRSIRRAGSARGAAVVTDGALTRLLRRGTPRLPPERVAALVRAAERPATWHARGAGALVDADHTRFALLRREVNLASRVRRLWALGFGAAVLLAGWALLSTQLAALAG